MTKIICDLCEREVKLEDVRYIDFYKFGGYTGEERKPIHATLEICTICCDEVHENIIKGA